MALEVFPLPGLEKGLRPLRVQALDDLSPGVHIEDILELGRGGLDLAGRLIDDVLPLLVLGKDLGALGDGDRRLHGVAGRELEEPGGRHRVGHLEAGEVQKFRVELSGDGVHPVHGLIEHLPKELGQGGAGVVLRPLIPPFRGVLPGMGGQLLHQVGPAPGV